MSDTPRTLKQYRDDWAKFGTSACNAPAYIAMHAHAEQIERELNAARATLRDEFAKAAMNGILAGRQVGIYPDEAAQRSFQYADAMLAERSKEKYFKTIPSDNGQPLRDNA